MTFSFATVALTFWLGLVAVACLHRIWHASTSRLMDGNRGDRSASSRETYRDYHRPELVAEGLIPFLHHSLDRVLRLVQQVVSVTLTRCSKLVSSIVRPQTTLPALSRPTISPVTQVIDSRLPANANEVVAAEPFSKVVQKRGGTNGKTRATPQHSDRKRVRDPNSTTRRSSVDHSEKKRTARVPKGISMKAARSRHSKRPRPTTNRPLTLKPGG
jgi:hypothetical protein